MKQRIGGLGMIGWNQCFMFKPLHDNPEHRRFQRWKIARKAWKTRKARQRELGI